MLFRSEIGAEQIPQLMVYNKVDLLGEPARVERDHRGVAQRVWLSSTSGEGTDLLLEVIAERLGTGIIETRIMLNPEDGKLRSQFFELGAVMKETPCEDGSVEMVLKIQEASLRKIAGDRFIEISPQGLS